jgi:hypothetical protein
MMLWRWLGLPHLSIANILWCVCTHPINVISVHLLCCTTSNEHMGTHDAICDTFVVITRDVDFHVKWKQLHALLSTTFHSFHWWVDIMLTKDGIHTLVNVVIANPTWVDLLHQSYATKKFVTFEIIQVKEKSYHDWHPIDHFLILTIEMFGCLNKQADVFLHDCLNAMWNFKRLEGLYLSVWVTFCCQKISITLQRMLDASILHLKSSDSNSSHYFPSSTPSRHTSHHYG